MSDDNPSTTETHNQQAMEQLGKYVDSLTKEEKSKFLLSILSDSLSFDLQSTPDVASASFAAPITLRVGVSKNRNFRSRCGCDQVGTCPSEWHGISYATLNYRNVDSSQTSYDIVVRIKHYGLEYYGTGENAWKKFIDAPIAYGLFISGRLSGPENNSGGGYFQSGNNDTPREHYGALGVEVFKRGTNDQVWWGLWYFHSGWPTNDWGNQWLRCGHDYTFIFRDNQ